MITKEKLEKAGSSELSRILLSLYEANPKLQKHLDIIFAGLDQGPKKLISVIKKEISNLKRSSRFVDYYESDSLADRLDQVRVCIANDLSNKSPEEALKLMRDFLNLHLKTMEHCDDSNGAVSGVFINACEDFGKIYSKNSKPYEEVAQVVFDLFTKDEYGVFDNIISDFHVSLGDEGLHLLSIKLKKDYDRKDSYTAVRGLKDIADCQNNIDSYIEACNLQESRFPDQDYIEISSRFIDNWEASKAIEWLDKVDAKNNVLQEKVVPLRIKALELKGDYEQAEQESISWFCNTLSSAVYVKILSNAKPEFKENFKKYAIEKAFNFSNAHSAIKFLTDAQEFEACGKLIHLKIEQLSGDNYYALRPAAKILQQLDPLASTLLYRKLIHPVLENAKYKYYNYAAQDLAICTIISPNITDWKGNNSHDIYFALMKESHKRKTSFWPQYNSSLEKQSAKLTNSIYTKSFIHA